jgi:hypothetical protein
MKWMVLAILGTALIVNGQGAKPHSDVHKNDSASKGTNASDTAGQTVVVVNQQAPQRQENDQLAKPPSYFHELLVPANLPSLLLVGVGIAGIVVAVKSLRRIDKQIIEMRRQVDLTFGQLRAMHEQIAEMSEQTTILDKSVAVAKESADAAKESVEVFRKKDRARLRVHVGDLYFATKPLDKPPVVYTVHIHGLSEAFIVESKAALYVSDSKPLSDEVQLFLPMAMMPDVIKPNTPPLELKGFFLHTFTDDEIAKVKAEKAFVHFDGFIRYTDVFDRKWKFTVRRVWQPSTMYGLGSADHGYWLICGGEGEAQDT